MIAALRVSDELAAWVRRTGARAGLDEITAAFEAGEIETRAAAPRAAAQRADNRLQRRRGLARRRSPDRQKSYERRHRLAWSGPLPGYLAARFTISEMAVMRIIADKYLARERCDLSLDEIADRAGVCRKTAQRALRNACVEKLIEIDERPVRGRKNLTNIVRVISGAWVAWLEKRRSSKSNIGGHLCPTTDTRAKQVAHVQLERPQKGGRGGVNPAVCGINQKSETCFAFENPSSAIGSNGSKAEPLLIR
jgi:hypothetical protein